MHEVQQDLLWRQAGYPVWLARKCADKNAQRRLIATAAECIAELVGVSGRKVDAMVKGYEPIEASLAAQKSSLW